MFLELGEHPALSYCKRLGKVTLTGLCPIIDMRGTGKIKEMDVIKEDTNDKDRQIERRNHRAET